jgi:glycosyltransferase involved in cell wall biosynthesis
MNTALNQTMRPDNVLVNIDFSRRGAAATRDMLLKAVDTKYTCILDDDDWLMPHHIETLYNVAEETDADLVYPWFKTYPDGYSHLEMWRGVPWNNDSIHQVPITWMAKTESLKAVGGFSEGFDLSVEMKDQYNHRIGEDFLLIHKFVHRGMKIVHVNKETWVYNMSGGGTHGKPDKW